MPGQLSRLEIALGTQVNSGPLRPAPLGAPETPAGELGLSSSQSRGIFAFHGYGGSSVTAQPGLAQPRLSPNLGGTPAPPNHLSNPRLSGLWSPFFPMNT